MAQRAVIEGGISMFDRIVLAANGAANSWKAVWATVDLAEKRRSDVLVLHVLEGPKDPPLSDVGGSTGDCIEFVDKAVSILKDAGVSATGEARMSASASVPWMIVEAARERDASLIVIGSGDRTDGDDPFLRNVTERVLHIAPSSVLVVR
ncbi:MAG TPA: universal stress protein [Actinomycetota bacterium]|jgi:nucleotide-binding universal stress UspA family protein